MVLDGRYRLDKPLKPGGMGDVWVGDDLGLDRKVAIKFVLARLDGNPTVRARLVREAKAAASLQHPGITVVHALGEYQGKP